MLTSRAYGRQGRDVAAVELDRPVVRQLEAGDHAQGGGLAGARRAEHGEELALANLEVDPRHRHDVAVALREALEAERVVHSGETVSRRLARC